MRDAVASSKSVSTELRVVQESDLPALIRLEEECFASDRLSSRRLRHWVEAGNRIFLVATLNGVLSGYCLILLHRGTRLARLYSIAVGADARGCGLGRKLLVAGEEEAARQGRLYMRLEVALNNHDAIALYRSMGYQAFGSYADYYEDHQDALRMQKRIRYLPVNLLSRQTPWYQQTTEFTCGPASLLMAMASLSPQCRPDQGAELDIWREATTIFMTSGLGGCHPLGLALAAHKRGFVSEVFLNQTSPLFLEGVRSTHKKNVMRLVDEQFQTRVRQQGIKVQRRELSQKVLEKRFNAGMAALMLISTYRMDGKKSPHWVVVTGFDERCIYVHDPDPSDASVLSLDCQHVPIAREDFDKMSSFGRQRLRTAVLLAVPGFETQS